MFIIKELVRGRAQFGEQIVPGIGRVDWGRKGENLLVVPDEIGRSLIAFGRNFIYREVKIPAPIEPTLPVPESVLPVPEPVSISQTQRQPARGRGRPKSK